MTQRLESEFLLHCLSYEADEMDATRFSDLSDAGWDQVIQQADWHRIGPLLYHFLRENNADLNVPVNAMKWLKEAYLHTALENTQRYHRLSKLLNILKEHNIPVIVLKGAALANLIYRDISLRPMTDVDLLVRDIYQVGKVLSPLGYEAMDWLALSRRHINWRHRSIARGDEYLEFHTRIPGLPKLDPWKNACHLEIASVNTLIAGCEDMLLHLCIHLYRNLRDSRSSMLIQWYDILKVLEHYDEHINWDYVIQTARANRVENTVHGILSGIKNWFDGDVPMDVLSQLRHNDSGIDIIDIMRPAEQANRSEFYSLLYSLSNIPAFHNKVYHILRWLFPCREYMVHRYGITRSSALGLYYFFHMGIVFSRVMKALSQFPEYLRSRLATDDL